MTGSIVSVSIDVTIVYVTLGNRGSRTSWRR